MSRFNDTVVNTGRNENPGKKKKNFGINDEINHGQDDSTLVAWSL